MAKKAPKLTKNQQALLDECNLCEGTEVQRQDWEDAQRLVDLGLAESLGPARGPARSWRRLYPLEE